MGAVGAAGGEVVGGIVGDIMGSGDRKRARRAMEQALQDIMASNPEVDRSSWLDVETDPALRMAQTEALQGFQREARAGGMGVQSRAALAQAGADTARRERGAREAILQGMAARGQAGQGAELAATLANQQGAAERNAIAGTQAAADARRRQLQALSESGKMAGGMRGQDFTERGGKASALDEIARFNADARLRRAGMLANVRSGQAAQYEDSADRWRRRGAGVGSAAGSALPI